MCRFPDTLCFDYLLEHVPAAEKKLLAKSNMNSFRTSDFRKLAIAMLTRTVLNCGSFNCVMMFLAMPPACSVAQTPSSELKRVVASAFAATHDGWSVDEVILNDDLNRAFLQKCREQLPEVAPADLNWRLLNMRKAGTLKTKTTRSGKRPSRSHVAVAEMVSRSLIDQHAVTIDRIMVDPKIRVQFDEKTSALGKELDKYLVRKAAFGLRKKRRLRPELIARIADWGRSIQEFPLKSVEDNPKIIPHQPGIYIFRDASGYLYIGQSVNLHKRLKEHLDESSNFSLSKYLNEHAHEDVTLEIHAFPVDSRAKETMIRRAYESELIASRRPKFNIQP
jgi:predicted GIY-YIG superfamily endonuclease